MIKYCGPRGNGKTERLLKFAADNNCGVLCLNKRALEYKARNLGYNIVIYDVADYLNGYTCDTNVVVDNVDDVMEQLLIAKNTGCCAISLTT